MTPMSLERAVEVAIVALTENADSEYGSGELDREAAAVLRAALPFIKVTEHQATEYLKSRPDGIPFGDCLQKLVAAYRAFKETK